MKQKVFRVTIPPKVIGGIFNKPPVIHLKVPKKLHYQKKLTAIKMLLRKRRRRKVMNLQRKNLVQYFKEFEWTIYSKF